MTKKQVVALQRMIDRETSRIEWKKQNRKEGDSAAEETAGVHPSHEKYIVTDGYVAVVFPEMPAELPEAERNDSLYDLIQNDIYGNDHFLAMTVTAAHISEWKRQAKPWKVGKNHKTGAVPVEITAQHEDGSTISGFFNPVLLVDAVESVGTGAMAYIGHNTRWNSHLPTLFIYPKDWMGTDPKIMGYVLPLRI